MDFSIRKNARQLSKEVHNLRFRKHSATASSPFRTASTGTENIESVVESMWTLRRVLALCIPVLLFLPLSLVALAVSVGAKLRGHFGEDRTRVGPEPDTEEINHEDSNECNSSSASARRMRTELGRSSSMTLLPSLSLLEARRQQVRCFLILFNT